MPGLDLYLDASGITKGAAEANRALDSIGPKAVQAETKVVAVNKALQITAGSREAAQSITSTAAALGTLNAQGAAFSASKFLIDISRMGADFKELSVATSTAAATQTVFNSATMTWETVAASTTVKTSRLVTVFRTLGAVIRANPIGLLATGLAAVAAGMSLFGSSTDDATKSIERQTSEIDRLLQRSRELDIRRGYTGEDPRQTVGGTVDVLTRLRLEAGRQKFSVDEAAGLFGAQENDLRYALGMTGVGERAFELDPTPTRYIDGVPTRLNVPGKQRFLMQDVSRDQLIRAGEFMLNQRRDAATPRSTPTMYGPTGDEASTQMRGIAEEQERRRDENARRAEEHMERMVMLGEMIGDSLGNAFADAALRASSLRQALAAVVQEFARFGLRSAFAGLGGSIFGQFGQTSAQFQGPPTATGAGPGPVS